MKYSEYTNIDFSSVKNPAIDIPTFSGEVTGHIHIRRLTNFYDRDKDRYFRILYVKMGVKSVEIDYKKFESFANLIVFISPGQKLKLELSANPVGWVFHFSKAYYNLIRYEDDENWTNELFPSGVVVPKLVLSPEVGDRIHAMACMIDELRTSHIPGRANGVKGLLNAILVYCNCRCNVNLNDYNNTHEISIISKFKQLVNDNYSRLHMVSEYSRMLNITPKYLNQVVKHVLGITAKQVIQEQIISNAKKELKFSNRSIKDIADSLGFSDPYHFSSSFKELAGTSPMKYRDR